MTLNWQWKHSCHIHKNSLVCFSYFDWLQRSFSTLHRSFYFRENCQVQLLTFYAKPDKTWYMVDNNILSKEKLDSFNSFDFL